MTPQEKELIQNVFERLARSGVGQKDAEAEALIRDGIQRTPDAAYGLVQAVIVQEMGLNQATARINELQRQLDEARARQAAPAAGAPQGGFLGGASPWGAGSVPRSGAAPSAPPPPAYGQAQTPAYAPAPAYAPPPPAYAAPQPAAGGPWGQPQQPAGGGFLRNAATMAAGVAGGALIAEGISSLFSGHRGGLGGGFGGSGLAGGSPWGGGTGNTVENVTVNNYYGDQEPRTEDARYEDSRYGEDSRGQQDDTQYQDASYEPDSYDDGGYDDTSDV